MQREFLAALPQKKPSASNGMSYRPLRGAMVLAGAFACLAPLSAFAHDMSEHAKQMMLQGNAVDVAVLGAEHMLTGWDHLLFLLGVLFFLNSFGQIVRFITAFTVGHTLTLLGATYFGISANEYLIDAVIALTVCYKAAENLGLFSKVLGINPPNLLYMVFLFGLIHGFGLSARLQQIMIPTDLDLVAKVLSFNVGVELGQIAALSAMIVVVRLWRETSAWEPMARAANAALLIAGLSLFAMQVSGYVAEAGGDAQAERLVAAPAEQPYA